MLLPGVTGVTLTIVDDVPTLPVVVITLSAVLFNQNATNKLSFHEIIRQMMKLF